MEDIIIKLREKIMSNEDFRRKLSQYAGVKFDQFEIYFDKNNHNLFIIIPTVDKNVFMIMDEKYNIMGIHRFNDQKHDFSELITNLKHEYYEVMIYFNLTASNIAELASRTDIRETNHGHSIDMMVNGQFVDSRSIYSQLLCFVVYLNELIKEYYQQLLQAKILNFDYPNLGEYLDAIVNKINECVFEHIMNLDRPWPYEISDSIAQTNDYDMLLYSVVDLLLYENGFMIDGKRNYNKVYLHNNYPIKDLSVLTKDLLTLLDVPMEEVKKRIKKVHEDFKIRTIDLDEVIASNNKTK